MKKHLKLEDLTKEEQDYQHITNIDQREHDDKISLMAINELLNKKKLKSISRIKFEQVAIITKLYLFNATFGESYTKLLGDLILELQISTNGLGRKELVQLVQQREMFGLDTNQVKKSKDIFR